MTCPSELKNLAVATRAAEGGAFGDLYDEASEWAKSRTVDRAATAMYVLAVVASAERVAGPLPVWIAEYFNDYFGKLRSLGNAEHEAAARFWTATAYSASNGPPR